MDEVKIHKLKDLNLDVLGLVLFSLNFLSIESKIYVK